VQTDPNALLYMRARYYNTNTRRFLNADPIGFAGGMNWFGYVNGDPVNRFDLNGLEAVDVSVSSDNMTFVDRFLDGFPTVVNSPAAIVKAAKSHLAPGDTIKTLTINAHGSLEGEYITFGGDGQGLVAQMRGTAATPGVEEAIKELAPMMDPSGVCILQQCRTAFGRFGSQAMKTLSKMLGVPVIGTKGDYNPWDGFESGTIIVYPDGREADFTSPSFDPQNLTSKGKHKPCVK
jgi:RHS repeat-associated protein